MSLLQQIRDAVDEDITDMAVVLPLSSKEELMGRVAESVTAKDSRSLQAYIMEQRLADPDQFWELTSLLAPTLTTQNLEVNERWFKTTRRCIAHFARHGKAKEMVLALLEQVEGCTDDALYISLLPSLQEALLRLPVKRGRSLELALDTLGCHIAALPAPSIWDLEGEEMKLLELDESVRHFLDVVPAFVDFMQPFLRGGGGDEEDEGRRWEKRVLKKHLLQLLQHPLVFLDLRYNSKEKIAKTYSREMAESVISALFAVDANFYRLIVQDPAEIRAVLTERKKKSKSASSKDVEDVDMEAENAENERRAQGEKGSEEKESEATLNECSEMAAACLAYLVQVEWLGLERWPAVVNSPHMLHVNLPFVHILLTNPAHTAVYKGISLLSFSLDALVDSSLTLHNLDDANFTLVVNALIHVMRFCPVRELRISALCVFKTVFHKVDCRARHQVMKSVLASCQHAGVKAVIVGLIKDEIASALQLLQNSDRAVSVEKDEESNERGKVVRKRLSDQDSLPVYFFSGKLKQLLTLATKLPDGAASDLLEEYDLVMATLNLIRYLSLRDLRSTNLTGFWDMTEWLEKDYFAPLRTGLDMSVGHYQLELDNILKQQQKSGKGKKEDLVSTVSVLGLQLPAMNCEQRIDIMGKALTTFDMIKCVLARVAETIDQNLQPK